MLTTFKSFLSAASLTLSTAASNLSWSSFAAGAALSYIAHPALKFAFTAAGFFLKHL